MASNRCRTSRLRSPVTGGEQRKKVALRPASALLDSRWAQAPAARLLSYWAKDFFFTCRRDLQSGTKVQSSVKLSKEQTLHLTSLRGTGLGPSAHGCRWILDVPGFSPLRGVHVFAPPWFHEVARASDRLALPHFFDLFTTCRFWSFSCLAAFLVVCSAPFFLCVVHALVFLCVVVMMSGRTMSRVSPTCTTGPERRDLWCVCRAFAFPSRFSWKRLSCTRN